MDKKVNEELTREIQSVVMAFGLSDEQAAGYLVGVAVKYMEKTGVASTKYLAAAIKELS